MFRVNETGESYLLSLIWTSDSKVLTINTGN